MAVRFNFWLSSFLAFPEIRAPFAHGLSGTSTSQILATVADARYKLRAVKVPALRRAQCASAAGKAVVCIGHPVSIESLDARGNSG